MGDPSGELCMRLRCPTSANSPTREAIDRQSRNTGDVSVGESGTYGIGSNICGDLVAGSGACQVPNVFGPHG